MAIFIRRLLEERGEDKFSLNETYLNAQMVRVLRMIGFDRDYRRAEGPYLFDAQGNRYLDLLSGWGTSRSAAINPGSFRRSRRC